MPTVMTRRFSTISLCARRDICDGGGGSVFPSEPDWKMVRDYYYIVLYLALPLAAGRHERGGERF